MVKYSLDTTFAALADPTRRAMLAHLRNGELAMGELAAPFDMSLVAISKHLDVLERAGLVVSEKRGRTRLYRMRAIPMKEAAECIEMYRGFWEEQFDSLTHYLEEKLDANKNRPE